MVKRKNIVCVITAMLIAGGVAPGIVMAQTTASVPKPQDKLAIGENDVKQLLLLMDTNKNGKIDGKEKGPAQKYLRQIELGQDPDKAVKTMGRTSSSRSK